MAALKIGVSEISRAHYAHGRRRTRHLCVEYHSLLYNVGCFQRLRFYSVEHPTSLLSPSLSLYINWMGRIDTNNRFFLGYPTRQVPCLEECGEIEDSFSDGPHMWIGY